MLVASSSTRRLCSIIAVVPPRRRRTLLLLFDLLPVSRQRPSRGDQQQQQQQQRHYHHQQPSHHYLLAADAATTTSAVITTIATTTKRRTISTIIMATVKPQQQQQQQQQAQTQGKEPPKEEEEEASGVGGGEARVVPKQPVVTAVDNPCWGDSSPSRHCLEYLLTLLEKQQCILHHHSADANYIVINKPPDLRMDGEYPATVHKLITYWFPPPTLLAQFQQSQQDIDNTTDKSQLLLNYIQTKLHRHSDFATASDKLVAIRPCHQLDYATSGVLLLARNTKAAAHASTCFEQRLVDKTYLAIVHGHVNMQHNKTLPVLSPQVVTRFVEQQERRHKRSQHKKRRHSKTITFQGYQPPNSFLQIWQGRYNRRKKQKQLEGQQQETNNNHNHKKQRKKKGGGGGGGGGDKLTEEQWDEIDQIIANSNDDDKGETIEERISKLRSFKELKKSNNNNNNNNNPTTPILKDAIEKATNCYNDFLKEILDKEEQEQQQQQQARDNGISIPSEKDFPTIFRLEGEAEDNPNVFYIYLPVAQVEDEFAMRIPPTPTPPANNNITTTTAKKKDGDDSVVASDPRPKQQHGEEEDQGAAAALLKTGDPTKLTFKVALTKCTILETATSVNGIASKITKLQLQPRTGRRHQLRVHTAYIGHPIVGDMTYTNTTTTNTTTTTTTGATDGATNTNTTTTNNRSSSTSTSCLSPRMCLHAYQLGFPLPSSPLSPPSKKKMTCTPATATTQEKENGKAVGGGGGGGGRRYKQGSRNTQDNDNDNNMLRVTAPDPFPISKDGRLTISTIL